MIGFDPQEVVWVRLRIHEKRQDAPPEFGYRFLTCREVIAVEKLLKQAREEQDQDKKVGLLVEAVSKGLTGWKNVEGVFDTARLPDLVTPLQMWELAHNTINAVTLREVDLGKSISPSPTPADTSASGATPTAGSA